jgi:pyridoxamine 5'-phosphate oxidase
MPPLRRSELAADPIEVFRQWFERAERELPLAEAMTLATVDRAGRPDARMVLLKGFGADGFRFFTNYGSAKGLQLEATGWGAVVLYWRELDRQVRARGPVGRLDPEASDLYFAGRPRDAQVGAWASPQSQVLPNREDLEGRVAEVEGRFAGAELARPEFWGGYLLVPEEIEFWQGQAARLHDRFRYTRSGAGWALERLAP